MLCVLFARAPLCRVLPAAAPAAEVFTPLAAAPLITAVNHFHKSSS
jgi:hypothetical protein